MSRFSSAPHPQHAQRSSRRRNRARYALVSCILTTLVTLPGVASFQSSAVADAPLETPGAASITLSRSQGRIGQAVLNDSETDRTTAVPDNSYFGVIKGMEPYNSADSTVITTDFGPDEGFTSVRVLPAKAGTGDAALPGIRVVDTQVGHLPLSGSTGIYPDLGVGSVLMVAAGAIVWMKRREGLRA